MGSDGSAAGISSVAVQARLVARLCAPACHGLPATACVDVIETHISFVILAGDWAYKIKKPIDFGFLDFSTLEKRRHFCHEEIRLNRRLAPAVYVDVVPITGTLDAPAIGGAGPVLDYAVRMRRFSQDALFGPLLTAGRLEPRHIDELARLVAAFHESASVAPPGGPYGRVDRVAALALANIDAVMTIASGELRAALERLRDWTSDELARLEPLFAARAAGGRVRECHGDLHLGNIALVEGAVTVFDCIEFNEAMRWIDVVSEVAFTVMDLEDRGNAPLAYRYVNAYLERCGDYGGLRLLPFYLTYRAMVRAKIAALRLAQVPHGDASRALYDESAGYVALAGRYATRRAAGVVVMHGLSGSGKSVVAGQLAERLSGVRVRTDAERQRLRSRRTASAPGAPAVPVPYSADETRMVYAAVEDAVDAALDAGVVAIADGAFLRREDRHRIRALAARRGLPCAIVSTEAPVAILRERIAARRAAGQDPSEADATVLDRQIAWAEGLSGEETADVVVCRLDMTVDDVVGRLNARFARG